MKKILSILLTTISLMGYSQNFNMINPDRISFFESNNAIKIDSIAVHGNDTVYYPYKIWNFNNYECVKKRVVDWAGQKIIKNDNKVFYFISSKNDTVKIKPYAGKNSNWHLYNYQNGNYIEAQINDVLYQSIFNIQDSIKTIKLTKKDSSGKVISHPINGKEIKISKNHGLTHFLNLDSFPEKVHFYNIQGVTNPNHGKQPYMKRKQIYNFEIGDVFHYYKSYTYVSSNGSETTTTYLKKTVTDKWSSVNKDTVIYNFDIRKKRVEKGWNPDYYFDTIYEYTQEKKYIFNNEIYLPKEAVEGNSFYSPYYSLTNQYINNRKNMAVSSVWLNKKNDTCWELIHYDPPTSNSYLEGCGLFKHEVEDDLTTGKTLEYYKKGDEEWGDSLTFTSINNHIKYNRNKISLYPNPAINDDNIQLTLNNEEEIESISFISLKGEKIYEIKSVKSNQININNLSPGIYITKIKTQKSIYTKRFIKY